MSETQAEKFARAAKEREKAEKAQGNAKPARGWRYHVRRAVLEIIAGYVMLCLILFVFQKKFIYIPGRDSNLDPRQQGFAAQQAEALEARASDGVTIRGWHLRSGRAAAPAPEGGGAAAPVPPSGLARAPLLDLFFCGNAGNRADRRDTFIRLAGLGPDVVCFDYRGYGDSEGSPDEEGLARDARAAWDCLIQQGVKPQQIVIHGESLGGAAAIRLAAELCAQGTPPAGLITQATFTSLTDVAAKHYWFVPVSLILTQRFPSLERIPQVTCPILMFHGNRDDIVPFALGRRLFAAAPEKSASGMPKQFVELAGCGHNDIGITDSETYVGALRAFYTALCPELVPKATGRTRRGGAFSDQPAPRPPREKRPRP